MKKIMLMLLCGALLFSSVACNKKTETNGNTDQSQTVYDDNGASRVSSAADDADDGSSCAGVPGDYDGVINGKATLYRPDGEYMYIETVEVDFEGDPIALIETMVENNALVQGISADEFCFKGTVLAVNLNKAYQDYVCAGSTAEYFGLGCLVNTLIANYSYIGVEKIQITIEGYPLQTHGGYSEEYFGMME